MNNGLSSYINGLVNMISSVSKKIGYSFIEGYCLLKDDFKEEFCNNFKIKDFKLEEVNNNYLSDYIEDDLIENLLYWLHIRIGKEIKYYTIDNLDLKNTLFYIVDDIVVIEYDKYMVCLIIGNNE